MWDLGGTLVDASRLAFARQMGLYDLTVYYVWDSGLDKDQILRRIFETLETLGGAQECADDLKCKHENAILPQYMAHWLEGNIAINPKTL